MFRLVLDIPSTPSQSNFPPCLQTSEKVWFSPRGGPKQNLPIRIHFLGHTWSKDLRKNPTKMRKLLLTKVYVETCFKSSGAHPMRLHVQMTQVCVGKCSDTAMAWLPLRGNYFCFFFSLLFCVQKILYSKHLLLQSWKIAQLKNMGKLLRTCANCNFPVNAQAKEALPKKKILHLSSLHRDYLLDKYTLTCGGNWHDWKCNRDQRGSLWVNIMTSRYIQFGSVEDVS